MICVDSLIKLHRFVLFFSLQKKISLRARDLFTV